MKNRKVGGRVIVHRVQSRALKRNPLEDPTERDLYVYLPPGYEHDSSRTYPALLALVGYMGTGGMFFNVNPFGEDLKTRLDRLIATGKCLPAIVVAPDCFTKVGGNQYINSTATGRYEDYLLHEIIPFVCKNYPIKNWGVFGKSSGGFGAMALGMRHPDVFKALADHSGDSNFELCYLPDFPKALDAFHKAGGPARWLKKFWADSNRARERHMKPLNMLGMAAHYSPNPKSPHMGIDFPFDLDTGVFRPEVWKRWRLWDPVHMVSQYARNLKKLRLIYVDCGSEDEFSLHWGARALVDELRRRGIKPHYEEFKDGHMNTAYRYNRSIPLLVKALSKN